MRPFESSSLSSSIALLHSAALRVTSDWFRAPPWDRHTVYSPRAAHSSALQHSWCLAGTEQPVGVRRYDNGGGAAGVTTLTSGGGGGGGRSDRRITLAMVKDEGLGTAGNTAFVQVGQSKQPESRLQHASMLQQTQYSAQPSVASA